MKITAKSKKADILTAYKKLEKKVKHTQKQKAEAERLLNIVNTNKAAKIELVHRLKRELYAQEKINIATETALRSAENAINYHTARIEELEAVIVKMSVQIFGESLWEKGEKY